MRGSGLHRNFMDMSESMTLYGRTDLCFALTSFIIPNICFMMATKHQLTFQCKSLSQQQKIAPDWQKFPQCTVYKKTEFYPSSHSFTFHYAEFCLPYFVLILWIISYNHPNFFTSLLTLLCRSLITIISRTIICTYSCGVLLLIFLHWENWLFLLSVSCFITNYLSKL